MMTDFETADAVSKPSGTSCRLCRGRVMHTFDRKVLRKYDVSFYECLSCGSLQTEQPYWLDESYADHRRVLDVGGLIRVEKLRVITICLFRILSIRAKAKLLDWGAGDGLFVRMLRDDGIDAYHWDTYSQNVYAVGFEGNAHNRYDFITCFEVFEHLASPKDELAELFKCRPQTILATTSLYNKQGPDWDYLNLLTGRHVFFYSHQAIALIAKTHGYGFKIFPGFILFSRQRLSRSTVFLISLLAKVCNNKALMRLLYTLVPKNGLSSTDMVIVKMAVTDGKLWPSPGSRRDTTPGK